jgi:chemotaxis protein methyltransferase CheR
MSVASVQQQLHASGHNERIRLAPYLARLCETLAASMIGDSRPVKVEVLVEDGTASSTDAVSICKRRCKSVPVERRQLCCCVAE